jgi:predicted short-subunit dehydrogenase-like oxidoreductase (DUF2520 family)
MYTRTSQTSQRYIPAMTPANESGAAQVTNPMMGRCDVIGRGRMGQALAAALGRASVHVNGPLGRGATGEHASIVLLCVPDREIGAASARLSTDAVVGHVSASAPLSLLVPHPRFVMHPLLSISSADAQFSGATCAVAGNTPATLGIAIALAERLGMRPRVIDEDKRATYHAAASAASNYVTTTLGMAERLAQAAGLERDALTPLVRSAVEQWAARGAAAALTGPVTRGDEVTVSRQRDAVATHCPELLPLWDALLQGTRDLAGQPGTA